MVKTKLDKVALGMLQQVAINKQMNETVRTYLAVELVRINSNEEIELSVIDEYIMSAIDTIVALPDSITEEFSNAINGLLTLNHVMTSTVDSRISTYSLLRDGDFNPVINSIYWVCLEFGIESDKIKELVTSIFYESDVEYVMSVLADVHEKLRTNKEVK